MKYWRLFTSIPPRCAFVQNVCLKTCGVTRGSLIPSRSHSFIILCRYKSIWRDTFGLPFLSKNRNPVCPSIIHSTFGTFLFFSTLQNASYTLSVIGIVRIPDFVFGLPMQYGSGGRRNSCLFTRICRFFISMSDLVSPYSSLTRSPVPSNITISS